jgi:flagellar secretion chaperone FliS
MMNPYKDRVLEGASGVELTIALYDGVIRFMHCAIDAAERGDTHQRRAAVKRAMNIILHLQATLKTDIGGKPAEALSEFYIAMFALMLQGSQANSRKKFEAVIANVWNVREAWRQVAQNPVGPGISPLAARETQPQLLEMDRSKSADGMSPARWTV